MRGFTVLLFLLGSIFGQSGDLRRHGVLNSRSISAAAYFDGFIFTASMSGDLTVYSLASPESPLKVAFTQGDDEIRVDQVDPGIEYFGRFSGNLLLKENLLYVVSRNGSWLVFDIQNPLSPKLLKKVALNHDVMSLGFENGELVISNGYSIFLYDIEDPMNPRRMTWRTIPNWYGGHVSVALYHGDIWAAFAYDGLSRFVRDDRDALILQDTYLPSGACSVFSRGGDLYFQDIFGNIYQLSEPSDPINDTARIGHSRECIWDIAVDESEIRTFAPLTGISRISRPDFEPAGAYNFSVGSAMPLKVGNYFYVFTRDGMQVYSDQPLPSLSLEKELVQTLDLHRAISLNGELVVFDPFFGVSVLERPENGPARFTEPVQVVPYLDKVVDAGNGNAFVVFLNQERTTRSLALLDLDDPRNPVLSDPFYQVPSTYTGSSIYFQDDMLYFSSGSGAVVFDVSNPSAPNLIQDLGHIGVPVLVRDDVYVTGPTVRFYDIADPGSPVLMDFPEIPSSGRDVLIEGDILFILTVDEVHAVSLADPRQPVLISTFSISGLSGAGSPRILGFRDQRLLVKVNQYPDYLMALDYQNPAIPVNLGLVSIAGNLEDVRPDWNQIIEVGGEDFLIGEDQIANLDFSTPLPEGSVFFAQYDKTLDTHVFGDALFLFDQKGIFSFGLEPDDTVVPLDVYLSTGTKISEISVSGDTAFLISDLQETRVTQLHTDGNITEVGVVPRTPVCVAASGDSILMADRGFPAQLTIYDRFDLNAEPATLMLPGAQEEIIDLHVEGELLWVLEYFRLSVYNISDLTQPQLLNEYWFGYDERGRKIHVSEDYIAIGLYPRNVLVFSRTCDFDLTYKNKYTQLGSLDIHLEGRIVMPRRSLAGYTDLDQPGPGFISAPAQLTDVFNKFKNKGWSFSERYLRLLGMNENFLEPIFQESGVHRAASFDAQGRLVAAASSTGTTIYDVSALNETQTLAHLAFNSVVRDCRIIGETLYVLTDNPSELQLYDIVDPENPVFILAQPGPEQCLGERAHLLLDQDLLFLYQEYNTQVEIYDVGSQRDPQWISTTTFDQQIINKIAVQSGIAFIVSENELRTYDLTDPTQPLHLDTFSFSGTFNDIVLTRDLAVLACNNHIQLIDWTDPSQLQDISRLDEAASHLAMMGRNLVISHDHHLKVVDLSSPAEPVTLGDVLTEVESAELEIQNERIYMLENFPAMIGVYGLCNSQRQFNQDISLWSGEGDVLDLVALVSDLCR